MDENIARKIVKSIAPENEDIIVEIGPGFGVLTKYLCPACRKLIAVEIDQRLLPVLQDKFGIHPHFELIHADFLKLDLRNLSSDQKLRLVGNIPYQITSQVIFKAFEARPIVSDLTIMIQREVADRIVALPRTKAYGILSVFSQLLSEPRIEFHVSRNVFRPRPEVDSSIVRWDFRQGCDKMIRNFEVFDQVVHASFGQRRKMLRKSLQQLSGFSKISSLMTVDLERRPEELTPAEFIELSNRISELWKK
jgi:16S rRNA (adenine1518-N6/adenine1519-N6)-dimethyltransferase